MVDDGFQYAVVSVARELHAQILEAIEWWADEPLGYPIYEQAQVLVRTLEGDQLHLYEVMRRELETRLAAAEAAGLLDEGASFQIELKLLLLDTYVGFRRKALKRAQDQQRIDAVVQELLGE